MTEREKQQLERIKSYGSVSVLIFAGCISLMMFFSVKTKIESQQELPAKEQEVVMKNEETKKQDNN